MDLLQLKYFCHAANTQNFSHTAQEFCVPPSNISQSIKRLEDELNISLFNRSSNRISLNSQGEVFYHRIRAALDLIDEAKREVCGLQEAGTLRLGVQINRLLIMRVVKKFRKLCPQVNISVSPFISQTSHNDFDMIVTSDSLQINEFSKEKIFSDAYVLAVPKGTLPTDRPITANDIRRQPFISLNSHTQTHKTTLAVCESFGFSPRIALQCENSAFLPPCVESGLGIAIIPRRMMAINIDKSKVDFHDIGYFPRNIYVYTRDRRYPPQYIRRFRDLLAEEYSAASESIDTP